MFVDIYSQGMRDRSMRSGTELAREIKITDSSMAGNLSNRSSGVQIPRDICTRLKRYLYSPKCSWVIILSNLLFGKDCVRKSKCVGGQYKVCLRVTSVGGFLFVVLDQT